MRVVTETTTAAEQIKWSRPRNQFSHHHPHPHPITTTEETDPINPQIPSIIQSTRCKSTISSLLLSTFSNTSSSNDPTRKKTNFSAAAKFRGLGCTAGASQQVSVPAVIRASADWQGKKTRKKKHKKGTSKNSNGGVVVDGSNPAATCVDFQDVWCGPGIGFSAVDAAAASVVSRKNNVSSSRGKIDVEKISHRERLSYNLGRRSVNPESISFLDTDHPEIFTANSSSASVESFRPTFYHRHIRDPSSSDGFAEIVMLQGGVLMGGRLASHDQFREWRLDVDNMSYEQLLELSERIGYVNTGLKEDEMGRNIRKIKLKFSDDAVVSSKQQHQVVDKKCSICQEEYEAGDEVGKLNCEHSYHFHCIKQWVAHKNFCPVCKQQVVARK